MKPIQLTVFIIWGALCFSLLMYAGMLSAMTFAPTSGASEPLTRLFALVAGIGAALSFVVRRLLLGEFSDGRSKVGDLAARNRFVAGNIVVFALSEGVGVLGLVNGLSSGGKGETWLPFIGGSLLLLLLHIPLPSRFRMREDGYQR